MSNGHSKTMDAAVQKSALDARTAMLQTVGGLFLTVSLGLAGWSLRETFANATKTAENCEKINATEKRVDELKIDMREMNTKLDRIGEAVGAKKQ